MQVAPTGTSTLTLAVFRDQFTDWINRTDISTQQANFIIQQAIARCNRELRIPSMEKSITVTPASAGNLIASIPLPDDFLLVKEVEADGVSCLPVSYSKMLRLPLSPGRGSVFARNEGVLELRPTAQTYARLAYIAAFNTLINDTDTTQLFGISPQVLLFASLAYGGDFFQMDQATNWEQRYVSERDTLNQMAKDVDTLGGPQAVEAQGYNYL